MLLLGVCELAGMLLLCFELLMVLRMEGLEGVEGMELEGLLSGVMRGLVLLLVRLEEEEEVLVLMMLLLRMNVRLMLRGALLREMEVLEEGMLLERWRER